MHPPPQHNTTRDIKNEICEVSGAASRQVAGRQPPAKLSQPCTLHPTSSAKARENLWLLLIE